jgi:hypothetical protein
MANVKPTFLIGVGSFILVAAILYVLMPSGTQVSEDAAGAGSACNSCDARHKNLASRLTKETSE